MTRREKLHALLFAVATALEFIVLIVGYLVFDSEMNPNLKRSLVTGFFLFSALNLTGFFWSSQRKVAALYSLLVATGAFLYLWESSPEIANYLQVTAQLRYSQLVWPISTLVQAFLVIRDPRVPNLLAVFGVMHAVAWLSLSATGGKVFLQMMVGFATDVTGMLSSGGLAVWLAYLGVGLFERRAVFQSGHAFALTEKHQEEP